MASIFLSYKRQEDVPLLTEEALASQFILAEIGTSRAYQKLRGTLIIPIPNGPVGIPEFIRNLNAITIPDESDEELAKAAVRIDQVIKAHLKRLRGQYRSPISDRHRLQLTDSEERRLLNDLADILGITPPAATRPDLSELIRELTMRAEAALGETSFSHLRPPGRAGCARSLWELVSTRRRARPRLSAARAACKAGESA